MEKIYSKIQPDKLLHIIFRKDEMLSWKQRQDIVPENNSIQCSALNLDKGHTFKSHYHVWKHGEEKIIAQESWCVIQGSVKCIFYDIPCASNSDTPRIIAEPILNAGDISFTLEGGHNYEILEDDTLVYEYKTGPYKGVENDKIRFVK